MLTQINFTFLATMDVMFSGLRRGTFCCTGTCSFLPLFSALLTAYGYGVGDSFLAILGSFFLRFITWISLTCIVGGPTLEAPLLDLFGSVHKNVWRPHCRVGHQGEGWGAEMGPMAAADIRLWFPLSSPWSTWCVFPS